MESKLKHYKIALFVLAVLALIFIYFFVVSARWSDSENCFNDRDLRLIDAFATHLTRDWDRDLKILESTKEWNGPTILPFNDPEVYSYVENKGFDGILSGVMNNAFLKPVNGFSDARLYGDIYVLRYGLFQRLFGHSQPSVFVILAVNNKKFMVSVSQLSEELSKDVNSSHCMK